MTMRALVVTQAPAQGRIQLGGETLHCAVVNRPVPVFDAKDSRFADFVLLRVLAFSVNYRDRALAVRSARAGAASGRPWSYALGSEFCAQVEARGANVDLKEGDIVIGDGAWPYSGVPGLSGGLPTNHASRELLVLHQAKLMRVPQGMDVLKAAAFPIGGQTAASMVRRLDLSAGSRVLVTAPTSNTSLFAIALLRSAGHQVDVVGRGSGHGAALNEMGIGARFIHDPAGSALSTQPAVLERYKQISGWDAVIDPYFDLWLAQTLPLLRPGGRYITCGLENQSAGERTGLGAIADPVMLMMTAMINNLSIIGNCIGTRADLAKALELHADGQLPVMIDSVFEADAAAFLARSFDAPQRLGKVVWSWK